MVLHRAGRTGRGSQPDYRADHGAEGQQGTLDACNLHREPDDSAGSDLPGQRRKLVLGGVQFGAVRAGRVLPAVCRAGEAAAEMDR